MWITTILTNETASGVSAAAEKYLSGTPQSFYLVESPRFPAHEVDDD
jgi:hypothetical protein